jgi:hypothetical protein
MEFYYGAGYPTILEPLANKQISLVAVGYRYRLRDGSPL